MTNKKEGVNIMEDRYLTVKDVAKILCIKPVTVYKWLREGQLKGSYFKVGGIYRFSESLLNKVLLGE